MQNFMELDMKKKIDPKAAAFGVWSLKTSSGKFGPKAFGTDLSNHKSRISETGFHFPKTHRMNPIRP